MRVALQLVALVFVGLVVSFFGLVLWARRGEDRPDLPGVRTICRFTGGSRYITHAERAAEAKLGSLALGEGVLRALCSALKASSVQTDGCAADDYGWGTHAQLNGEAAYLLLGRTGDEPDVWQLIIMSPSSGGPGPKSLLEPIDRALRSLDDIDDIVWHAREDLNSTAPFPEPIDHARATR